MNDDAECRKNQVSDPTSSGECGAVSVEFAIWTPILAFVILLVTDVTAAFTTQADMWRSASELARGVATGRLSPDDTALISRYTLASPPVIDSDGFVTVELVRDYADIGTGILLPPLGTMRVQLRHMVEPHVRGNS